MLCADLVGLEGTTINQGCTFLIGYGPGLDIDGTIKPLPMKHETGFDALALVDKQFTCTGEGQDGGPGFCGCQVSFARACFVYSYITATTITTAAAATAIAIPTIAAMIYHSVPTSFSVPVGHVHRTRTMGCRSLRMGRLCPVPLCVRLP